MFSFWLLVFGILAIGIVFVLAEVLFVPGGILGIIGGLLVLYSIYLPYGEGYGMAAHINLVAVLLVLSLLLIISIKSKTWKRMELSKNIESKVKDDMETVVKVGDRGLSVSRLTPMGKARFGNVSMEVKSYVGFVDPGQEIEVIEIEKDKIIVKPLK